MYVLENGNPKLSIRSKPNVALRKDCFPREWIRMPGRKIPNYWIGFTCILGWHKVHFCLHLHAGQNWKRFYVTGACVRVLRSLLLLSLISEQWIRVTDSLLTLIVQNLVILEPIRPFWTEQKLYTLTTKLKSTMEFNAGINGAHTLFPIYFACY